MKKSSEPKKTAKDVGGKPLVGILTGSPNDLPTVVKVRATLSGLDALLATVQMPPGVPVDTVAVDGTKNAAMLAARILAARILALKYPEIDQALEKAANKERARYEQSADAALAGLSAK